MSDDAETVALELLQVVITKAKNGQDWKPDLRRLQDMAKTEPAAKDLIDTLLKTLRENQRGAGDVS